MAETPAPKKGGALSGKWHGIPVPLVAAGAGGGAFLLYRWWKSRSTSTTATTNSTAAAPAATGTDTASGSGYTGGGQGGGAGANPWWLPTNSQPPGGLTTPTGGLTTPTDPSSGVTSSPTPPSAPISAPPSPGAPSGGLVSTPIPVAATGIPQGTVKVVQGSAINQGINTPLLLPSGPGTFNLPKGQVAFQPTASVRRGNQVAYGIGNPNEARAAENAGGTVQSGKSLMQKGWTGLTPGALYLLR